MFLFQNSHSYEKESVSLSSGSCSSKLTEPNEVVVGFSLYSQSIRSTGKATWGLQLASGVEGSLVDWGLTLWDLRCLQVDSVNSIRSELDWRHPAGAHCVTTCLSVGRQPHTFDKRNLLCWCCCESWRKTVYFSTQTLASHLIELYSPPTCTEEVRQRFS